MLVKLFSCYFKRQHAPPTPLHSFVVKESAHHSIYALICRQSGVVTTLGEIEHDGLYCAYCPLWAYFVSGSKCATITTNARQMTTVG